MSFEKVLIVDNEESVLLVVKRALTLDKMDVITFTNGADALKFLKRNEMDLILLDAMLEGMDGFETLKEIRKITIFTPVIMLSGRSEDYNTILGLGLGADDYMTKPFDFGILNAKIKALIRRSKLQTLNKSISEIIINPPFRFDKSTFKFFKSDVEINLSYKEMMIIKVFMENVDNVFSKEQLYQRVWGNDIVDDNTIMVHIRHLRSKIEDDPAKPKFIKTVWGVGYKFSTTN